MLLPQLRTKVNVDHAGHSPPLVPLKVLAPSRLVILSHSQNNNSLIAQAHSVTMVVMVVLWTMPSNTSNKTSSNPKATIPTLLKTVHATTNNQKVLLELPHTMMSQPTTQLNLWLLLLKVPFQLLLKLINQSSNHTTVVSFLIPHAEPALTTVSSLLDTVQTVETTTGSLRTHGVLTGVNLDSSELPDHQPKVPVSAVSKAKPHTPLSEHI